MTIYERAAQLWALLGLAAHNRQILTYGIVEKLTGVPQFGLGRLLEPVQSYCMLHKLPPLTILVVSEATGKPGAGFVAAEDIPKTQIEVFKYDWLSHGAPSPDLLEQAASKSPSNGIKPSGTSEKSLQQVFDEISQEAERRGLTPEILESILRDELCQSVSDGDRHGRCYQCRDDCRDRRLDAGTRTKERMQVVKIVVWEEDGALLGYLQDYPDYWTQGNDLQDLKDHLHDLYRDIASNRGGKPVSERGRLVRKVGVVDEHAIGRRALPGQRRLLIVALSLVLAIVPSALAAAETPATNPTPKTQPVDPVQEAIQDDVMETVLQPPNEVQSKAEGITVCYLSIRGGDPSDSFLLRYAGHRPPVKKASERKGRFDGVVLFVSTLKQIDKDTYEVAGGSYSGPLNAAGCVYTVQRVEKKWTITKSVQKWQS